MKACHLVIILAASLSAVNATALRAASKIPCSNCDDHPPHFEVEYPRAGCIFQTTTTLASVLALSSISIHFSRLKVKEISSSIMHQQNFSAEDVQ